MTIYYSSSKGGFFDSAIHAPAQIPQDAVQITAQERADLLAQQAQGKRIVAGDQNRPVVVDPPAPTADQVRASLSAAVQAHMDALAQSMGYDNIFTAVTYADEPAESKFQTEGLAMRAWRSQVWASCYALMAQVEAGTHAIPTAAELIAQLPAFTMS